MHFTEFLSEAKEALRKDVFLLLQCKVSMSNPKNNIWMIKMLQHNVTAEHSLSRTFRWDGNLSFSIKKLMLLMDTSKSYFTLYPLF